MSPADENQQGQEVPDEDLGQEPYDPDEDDGDGVLGDDQNAPPVRGAGVRQRALKARPPITRNQAKKVKKRSTRILAKEKQRKALELRKAGVTYEEIAAAVGYKDASGARKAVVRAFNTVIQEPVSELRVLRGEQLNHMLMTLWPKVQQGDESAIRTALAVMDKADALTGANQPAQINVQSTGGIVVVDGNKDDYIRAAQRMAGLGIQMNGTNAGAPDPAMPQLPATRYPPGMGPQVQEDPQDVVDGVVVEDLVEEESGTVPMPIQEPVQQPKKKFSFGVDPTVRKKDD